MAYGLCSYGLCSYGLYSYGLYKWLGHALRAEVAGVRGLTAIRTARPAQAFLHLVVVQRRIEPLRALTECARMFAVVPIPEILCFFYKKTNVTKIKND